MDLQTILIIITGLASLISGGLIAAFKTVGKEFKEAKDKWLEVNEDGKVTEKESLELAKEVMDVISETIKLGYILKKMVGIVRKKK